MKAFLSFLSAHEVITTLVSYWTLSAFIGALPAPGANSSGFYRFFFKFSNTLGGNLLRALSTAVESSPNFQAAVKLQNGASKQ